MKKMIIYAIISITIGYLIGNIIFTNKDIFKKNNENEKYYLLQEGTYYDDKILNNNYSSIKQKIIEKKDSKIHIYIGITRSLEVAEKIINIYEEKKVNLSIVEKYYSNEELKNSIDQFDLLINSSKDKEEILKIEEVVLASYDEIINSSNY